MNKNCVTVTTEISKILEYPKKSYFRQYPTTLCHNYVEY